jgi:sporulation protein YlmC with PRC-barrel domain
MKTEVTSRLVPLSDSERAPTAGSDDVRGYKVLDRRGEEVGTITDLFVDEADRRVRFLEIKTGGFLGLGGKKALVPIDAVSERRDDHVLRLRDYADHLARAPRCPPGLPDDAYWDGLYRHFGCRPFWSADYRYPSVRRITM